ncbi:MAG: response regulator [Dokdonella sp.]|uniref:response regulator n=1 Tax=Dokdonella sp. TaxID=2291710 RepID=UPI003F7DF765
MNASLPCVLFVDDEERILRSLRMLFRGRCEILTTTSGSEAAEWVRRRPVHVVVSDQRMPGMTGVEVLREVAAQSPATMRILLTGYADMDAVTASVNDGEIWRFIEKPWVARYLVDTVEHAARVAQHDFALAVARLAVPPPPVVGNAPIAARIAVLDNEGSLAAQVRDVLPAAVRVEHAFDLESTLELLADHDVAVVIARLSSTDGDVADALKQLKRLRPATLAIVVSSLRDSRLLIGLINEGQVFRFLLQPAPRELLRRGLAAALERHAHLRAQSDLLQRHAVDAPRQEPIATTTGRLLRAWRRLREAATLRSA